MYESAYPGVKPGQVRGENDPYVPIDVRAVAAKLGAKPELLFGRLYYDLDARHRYEQKGGASVHLFLLDVQSKRHSVNFPYLAAILAGHEQEYRKLFWSMVFSVAALLVSVASLAVSLLAKVPQ
ncbi:MAG: hypothetical protein ROZ00_01815 [Denitratisoma sp.]|nr:hypothetical protein [Denitratisoma sp.]